MTIKKKHILICTLAAAVICFVQILNADQPEVSQCKKEQLLDTSKVLTADDYNPSAMFFKMMFAVVLVVGLGITVVYVSKKMLPKITNAPGKEIKVIETAHLGPRKTLHIIKAGEKKLLIAAACDKITLLADISETLSAAHDHGVSTN